MYWPGFALILAKETESLSEGSFVMFSSLGVIPTGGTAADSTSDLMNATIVGAAVAGRVSENGRGNLGNLDVPLLGEATQHQVNHCEMDHRLTGLVPVFVMLAQAAIVRQP